MNKGITSESFAITKLTKEQEEAAYNELETLRRQLRQKVDFAESPGSKFQKLVDDGTVEAHIDQKMAENRKQKEQLRLDKIAAEEKRLKEL